MAASAQANDFAHLTANGLGLPVSALNFADLERLVPGAAAKIPTYSSQVTPATIVVVELGDNVASGTEEAFRPGYGQLLQAVSGAKKLICTSTFWGSTAADKVIQSECAIHGGTYVYIGDIYVDPANTDYITPKFSDPGVNMHPQDWGMSHIAQKIMAVAR